MDWLCWTAAMLALGLTLGNVLVASWASGKTDRRILDLEARLAGLERVRSADPYVYEAQDLE
jgi:hypothetical protein